MGWPGVVALMAIESANIPLPSEVIMPLSGWMLIKAQNLGAIYVLLAGFYGALGCTIGSAFSYWLGAWGGRPFLERWGRYFLISHHDLETADRWFSKYGMWAAFISRLLPVVRTFISFPAGVARVRLVPFLILTFLGSFPWCVGLAYGGYLLGEHWEELRSVMRPFDIPIIAVGLILVGWFIYHHVRRASSSGYATADISATNKDEEAL
jgi:membrane protein DedA with SNARE-associated domain